MGVAPSWESSLADLTSTAIRVTHYDMTNWCSILTKGASKYWSHMEPKMLGSQGHRSLTFLGPGLWGPYSHGISGQVENAEVRKPKYGNGNTEVRRKAP